MNKMKLFEAMNLIDDDLVKEASEDNVKPAADSSADKSITVSGVERYNRIAWHRLAAVASAVLLIAGIGAGGALMLKRRPPLLEETAESTTAEATAITEIKAEVSSTEKNGSSSEKEVPAAEEKTKESNDITAPSETETVSTEKTTTASKEEGNTVATTAMTTIQWKTSPANASTLPKSTTVTTAEVHYPEEKATMPTTEASKSTGTSWQIRSNIHALNCFPEDTEWLNNLISSLAYQPCTCDGLPEGIFIGSDGNAYQLNFSEGWIWRNGREEAPMPDEIRQYFVGIGEVQ